MMRADAGLHADQARRQVGKSRLELATRPFLPEDDRTTPIMPHDVERVLAYIDADHGDCAARFLRHGVLLVGAPSQLRSLAGLERGRTIPLPDVDSHCTALPKLSFLVRLRSIATPSILSLRMIV